MLDVSLQLGALDKYKRSTKENSTILLLTRYTDSAEDEMVVTVDTCLQTYMTLNEHLKCYI